MQVPDSNEDKSPMHASDKGQSFRNLFPNGLESSSTKTDDGNYTEPLLW